jgi:hypothetical protein
MLTISLFAGREAVTHSFTQCPHDDRTFDPDRDEPPQPAGDPMPMGRSSGCRGMGAR